MVEDGRWLSRKQRRTLQEGRHDGIAIMTGFYEKVIKVKADVAAVLDCTAQHRIDIVSLPPF
jgi:hypothetical protein